MYHSGEIVKYICGKCTASEKKLYCCDKPGRQETVKLFGSGIADRLFICPRKFIGNDCDLVMRSYAHYVNNLMPNSGGWADQTEIWNQAMSQCKLGISLV